jgi:hypothetical protein
MNREITALLLAAAAGAAHAQTVYRCGNTYSQQPCAGARTVAVEDARTPQQAAQSTASTRRDADLADAMEKQRLEEEKRAPAARVMGAGVANAGKAGESSAKASKQKRKPAPHQPEMFTAVAPGKPAPAKAKTKKPSS